MSNQSLEGLPPTSDGLMSSAAEYEAWRRSGSLVGGLIGGLIGAAIGAAIWAAISVATDSQYGIMAIGVGFLAGIGVRLLGKGKTAAFGVVGAVLALAGILAGNLAVIYILVQREYGELASLFTVNDYLDILKEIIEPIDLLFFGLALFFGYTTALNKPKK